MALRLLFFAQCADWAGRRELEVELAGRSRLADVVGVRSELAGVLERRDALLVAVNQEFSTLDAEVEDGDEIAFMPPFSGG